MPKSNLHLLQEAIASGDLVRAKELTDKLAKKAPSKPAKPSVKTKAKKTPAVIKNEPEDREQYTDESSYIASSKGNGNNDSLANRQFLGEDGVLHTRARRVSMAGTKFVNKFNPSEYNDLNAKEKKFEKQISKLKPTLRPGQPGAERGKAAKVEVQCSICHDWVKVYPWETDSVDGESSFRCSKRKCVRAR